MTRESSKKILVDVVDDDKSIVNLVKMMLEPTGYRVRTAKSAKQKLKHIKKEQPSVLVTDVKMPGEDGIWLAQKVHEINPNIPCIVITGHGERDTLIDAFKANCFGFLDKPFAQKELVNTLSRAVELRQLRDTNEQLRAGYNEIIEKNSDGLVVVGKKGTIKYANKAFSKYICANSLSDIVGRLFVFPVKPGEAYRTEVRLKTGELLTVEIGTYDISWLGKSAYLVGMRDVTERVKAEKANLRVQEAEFSNRKYEP